VDVNAPGAMAMLVAPLVSQLSVLPAPEFMPSGVAVKEVIVGAEPAPANEFAGTAAVQPASPAQTDRISTTAQKCNPEARGPRVLSPILRNEPTESMPSPLVVVDGIILATPPSSESVLHQPHRSQGMTLVMTKTVAEQTASHGARLRLPRDSSLLDYRISHSAACGEFTGTRPCRNATIHPLGPEKQA
jgi:hypothetical protein